MSDKMRWKYGDIHPVVAAVDAATVIEIGDLLYQDVDDAKPASMLANEDILAPSQKSFAENFLGVAMERSRAGDTEVIRVATTGVFEFDCSANTFELGDLIGVADTGNERGLEDQWVVSVTASTNAIARVAKRVAGKATSVLVDIRSTVMTSGI